jgi:hypothetical protein
MHCTQSSYFFFVLSLCPLCFASGLALKFWSWKRSQAKVKVVEWDSRKSPCLHWPNPNPPQVGLVWCPLRSWGPKGLEPFRGYSITP